MEHYDVVIIGAGAAGLFGAAIAGQRGRKVLVVDNGKKAGRKILISGGGRCNFTNLYTEAAAYISANPHFCKSALARYTQYDFIALVDKYQIKWHEKTLGQLFCDDSAQQIVAMLLSECQRGGVSIRLRTEILAAERNEHGKYQLQLNGSAISAGKLVVASGGLSMPGLGATPFGYKLAEQFGLRVLPVRAGLVPFTLHKPLLAQLDSLAGVAVEVVITTQSGKVCKEALLFTHRGVSGPAVLQVSSYWQSGEYISINLLPDVDIKTFIGIQIEQHPNLSLKNCLAKLLPRRLVDVLTYINILPDCAVKQLNHRQLQQLSLALQQWQIQPNGTEGYRTAEVTLGGVDTHQLSSRTMEAREVPGLYFIGEVVDVTGWLGGYNFQWAWSSAFVCGQSL